MTFPLRTWLASLPLLTHGGLTPIPIYQFEKLIRSGFSSQNLLIYPIGPIYKGRQLKITIFQAPPPIVIIIYNAFNISGQL